MRRSRLLPHPVRAALTALGAMAVEWIAPPTCAACDDDLPGGRVFCPACAATVVRLPLAPHGPHGSIAPYAFGGAVAEAVRRFKYGGRPDLARPLGHLLRAAARDAGLTPDLVVPVPLHPRRRAERGFDQAALLAGHVAASLEVPCVPAAARRLRHGPPQASLDAEQRRRSESLVFSAERRRVEGAVVLLVDDVVTTGATLRACRDALLAAGARAVLSLCLARAERAVADPAEVSSDRLATAHPAAAHPATSQGIELSRSTSSTGPCCSRGPQMTAPSGNAASPTDST